jgi:hypothetical protein
MDDAHHHGTQLPGIGGFVNNLLCDDQTWGNQSFFVIHWPDHEDLILDLTLFFKLWPEETSESRLDFLLGMPISQSFCRGRWHQMSLESCHISTPSLYCIHVMGLSLTVVTPSHEERVGSLSRNLKRPAETAGDTPLVSESTAG